MKMIIMKNGIKVMMKKKNLNISIIPILKQKNVEKKIIKMKFIKMVDKDNNIDEFNDKLIKLIISNIKKVRK